MVHYPCLFRGRLVHSRQGDENYSAIALQTMHDVFGATAIPYESVKQVHLFYVTLQWYQEHNTFHSVDKQAHLALPTEAGDNNCDNKVNMQTIIGDAIRSIIKSLRGKNRQHSHKTGGQRINHCGSN